MKNIIHKILQVYIFLFAISQVSAQNEIKLIREDRSTGIDIIDDTKLYLYYDSALEPSNADTFIVQLSYKDGKMYSSKFIISNRLFLDVSSEKEAKTNIKIFGDHYIDNGQFEIIVSANDISFNNICEAKILIVSKKGIIYQTDTRVVNSCGLNFIEQKTKRHFEINRVDANSFSVFGTDEPTDLLFYNVLGVVVGHTIDSKQDNFYMIKLTQSLFPAFIILNGERVKI